MCVCVSVCMNTFMFVTHQGHAEYKLWHNLSHVSSCVCKQPLRAHRCLIMYLYICFMDHRACLSSHVFNSVLRAAINWRTVLISMCSELLITFSVCVNHRETTPVPPCLNYTITCHTVYNVLIYIFSELWVGRRTAYWYFCYRLCSSFYSYIVYHMLNCNFFV